MRKIAHLSDLHFGEADPVIVAALLADINADPPHLVIVSGDLTKGARNSEFAEARRFFDQLGAPVLAVPGNHDISPYHLVQRFTRPYARFRRWIDAEIEPTYIDDELIVVGLNSARRWGPSLNWAHGRLSRRQVARAARRLKITPKSSFKIAVLHHPVLEPMAGSRQRIVGRLPAALQILDEAGVDILLAGHLHTGEARYLNVSPDRAILAIQCASATSARRRGEPNAFNRLTLEAPLLRLEVKAWSGTAFVASEQSLWIKGKAGWERAPGTATQTA